VRLRLASAVLAAAGAAITGYLTIVHYAGSGLVCPTSGCETVQRSRYAEIAGIPVALLGLIGFVALLAAALSSHQLAAPVGALLALVAFLFSAYLFAVQVFAIKAICTWCVTTDVLATLLLALTWLRLRAETPPTSSGPGAEPAARSGRGSRRALRPSR
jgi:uncharacterized membrane protein